MENLEILSNQADHTLERLLKYNDCKTIEEIMDKGEISFPDYMFSVQAHRYMNEVFPQMLKDLKVTSVWFDLNNNKHTIKFTKEINADV